MKLAASLFIAVAALAGGSGHAVAGKLATPAAKQCLPGAVYGQQSYSGWRPVWYRDANCRYTPVRLVRVGINRLRVQR